jgi:hypothetical protein
MSATEWNVAANVVIQEYREGAAMRGSGLAG